MNWLYSLKLRIPAWVTTAIALALMFGAATSQLAAQDTKPAESKPSDAKSAPASGGEAKAKEAKPNPAPKKPKLTGAELYAINCNRCHPERYATEFNSAQWKTVMMHMRVRANLPASQAKEILKYLQEDSGN